DTPRQECTKAAQRPDQCKGSNAGDAGSVLGLAFLPTTFDANQEAESRRQAGALKEFDVHDDLFIAVWAKSRKAPSAPIAILPPSVPIGQWQSKPSGLVLGENQVSFHDGSQMQLPAWMPANVVRYRPR